MIRADNIQLSIANKTILKDISVDIPKGKVTALIGPNGAGKSTLLHVLSRLQKQDSGEVYLSNRPLSDYSENELARNLSVLKQENRIGSRLKIEDLISFGRYPYNKGHRSAEDEKIIKQAVIDFDLESLSGRFLDTLSGGQKQRALLAMNFAQQTNMVLLDEPLNNLDLNHARRLMRLIKEQAKLGQSFVLVLHDLNYASHYADYIVTMKNGEVFAAGETKRIFQEDLLTRLYDTTINIIDIDGTPVALSH